MHVSHSFPAYIYSVNRWPRFQPPDVANRLDRGEEHCLTREKWWQFWIPRRLPPPAPQALTDAPVIPLVNASWLSKVTYSWLTPMMVLGYQRTLQATDLWQVDDAQGAGLLSDKLDAAWEQRIKAAEQWNMELESGWRKPSTLARLMFSLRSLAAGVHFQQAYIDAEHNWRTVDGRKSPSLGWALNDVFGRQFWIAGAFKVFGDTCQLMGPLLVKALINYAKQRALDREQGSPTPSGGRGIVMALGLLLLVMGTSLAQHQFWWHSMTSGVLARAALINSLYKRGVSLTGRARLATSNADLVNFISTDVSRIEAAAQWFHPCWTAPIQILICLAILLAQLGPSALAGFALFLVVAPLQERVMAHRLRIRRDSTKYTDERARTLSELLGAMRVVKYFSYEIPFLKRLNRIRAFELKNVRQMHHAQSANTAFAYSIPVLAATLSFIVYTSITHELDVAIIFSSFSLFQLLRQPMMFLPRSLSATADARNALERLEKVFHAELVKTNAFVVDATQELALEAEAVTFGWEQPSNLDHQKAKETGTETQNSLLPPFQIRNLNLSLRKGTLTAIVGRFGSGKSSLLQGLVGEMRMLSGHFSFGGKVAYCPQIPWIQNATLRENVLFGKAYNEERYQNVIQLACLQPDLRLLPAGDLTEIGERGINLSGGQKQRVNIARALYYDADVILFDDPLSAVDAHVGRSLFYDAILPLAQQGRTILLATHAQHFLSDCDYICLLEDGEVVERGTYGELLAQDGEFARLDRDFGGSVPTLLEAESTVSQKGLSTESVEATDHSGGGQLMVKERRTTGSVPWEVYTTYFRSGRGLITIPCILASILLMQSSQIANSYTLVLWQEDTFHREFYFYQSLYAGLGLSQAIFTFLLGLGIDFASVLVSRNLYADSIENIFLAPMSFFDTTPTGRIMSVFGKDIDTVDIQLPVSMRLFVLTMANVVGAVVIITVLEHYFVVVAFVVFLGYNYFAQFYRSSARELKRLDALLRSILYAHFSESLSGLSTIRSYGETDRFIKENMYYIDLENRALLLTVTNQRWLAVRLDAMGALLVFCVAIFAVIGVSSISPAQIGLVLTYTTQLTQLCGMVTRQSAEVENYMNSVERVAHYSRSDRIPQEAPHEVDDYKPPLFWPSEGSLSISKMSMKYRAGLPNVLKDVSLDIKGGEKVGIVGRTGAGKSSLVLALLRLVEYDGSIKIDGIDISRIGLRDLRSSISIIPQEPTLLSGTVRTNLDPFSLFDDAKLWDALRRSFLLDNFRSSPDSSVTEIDGRSPRLGLETAIGPDGTNLSLGERSLLSLARALVRQAKIVLMDEATASVDLETDKKIQDTIHSEFKDKTLICIAHRLRTIISYDRIVVMDSGRVAEFDTPLDLFVKTGSLFRSLCDQSNITRQDIEKARRVEEKAD